MNHPIDTIEEQQHAVRQLFERIPFNEYLGIELDEVSRQRVVMHLPMKHELVGNFFHGILHGGVIASLLDVVGGAMANTFLAARGHDVGGSLYNRNEWKRILCNYKRLS